MIKALVFLPKYKREAFQVQGYFQPFNFLIIAGSNIPEADVSAICLFSGK